MKGAWLFIKELVGLRGREEAAWREKPGWDRSDNFIVFETSNTRGLCLCCCTVRLHTGPYCEAQIISVTLDNGHEKFLLKHQMWHWAQKSFALVHLSIRHCSRCNVFLMSWSFIFFLTSFNFIHRKKNKTLTQNIKRVYKCLYITACVLWFNVCL